MENGGLVARSCVQLFAISWTVTYQALLWDSESRNTGVG